jgi:hypothetical protein
MINRIIIIPFALFLLLLISFDTGKKQDCTATYYNTIKYPIVHRPHSTAAVSKDLIQNFQIQKGEKEKGVIKKQGSFLIVTNLSNNKSDTVEVTDRCVAGPSHIDLSKTSFSKIANLTQGKIKVSIKKIN